jgi:uncharacterized membrane protein
MSYGDTVVRRVNGLVDDEYQERIVHQASTVGMQYATWASLLAGAVLAWVLPGNYSFLAFVASIVPMLTSEIAAQQWMKRYAPRPRYLNMRPVEWGMLILFLGATLAGLLVNAFDGGASSAAGMMTGSVIGAVVGTWAARRQSVRRRILDQRRLDADLED